MTSNYPPLSKFRTNSAFSIAIQFILVGCLWIVVSDVFVFFNSDVHVSFTLFHLEILKGLLFVLVMGGFVFIVIRKQNRSSHQLNYHELFLNNPQPMWIYDPSTLQFLDVNKAAEVRYGFSKQEFLNMRTIDVHPKNDHPEVTETFKEMEIGLRHFDRWQHIDKSGKMFTVEVDISTIELDNQRRSLAVCRDISRQEKYKTDYFNLLNRYNRELQERTSELTLMVKELEVRNREINASNNELIEINTLLSNKNHHQVDMYRSMVEIQCKVIAANLKSSNQYRWYSCSQNNTCLLSSGLQKLLNIENTQAEADFWKQFINPVELNAYNLETPGCELHRFNAVIPSRSNQKVQIVIHRHTNEIGSVMIIEGEVIMK